MGVEACVEQLAELLKGGAERVDGLHGEAVGHDLQGLLPLRRLLHGRQLGLARGAVRVLELLQRGGDAVDVERRAAVVEGRRLGRGLPRIKQPQCNKKSVHRSSCKLQANGFLEHRGGFTDLDEGVEVLGGCGECAARLHL